MGFKGKRTKGLFLTTSVKPRTKKALKSPYKTTKSNRSSPKEKSSSLKFGYIKSPKRKSKRGAPSPFKNNISFVSPLRKKQRTTESPFLPKGIISSAPKKSKRKLLNDHAYSSADNSLFGFSVVMDDSFDNETSVHILIKNVKYESSIGIKNQTPVINNDSKQQESIEFEDHNLSLGFESIRTMREQFGNDSPSDHDSVNQTPVNNNDRDTDRHRRCLGGASTVSRVNTMVTWLVY